MELSLILTTHTLSRIFALKDDPSQVVKARAKLNRMHLISRMLQTSFMLMLYYFFIRGTEAELILIRAIQITVDRLVKLVLSESSMTNNEAG